ncbi:MAG: serine hydrolase [Acidimicrobiia bacterium]
MRSGLLLVAWLMVGCTTPQPASTSGPTPTAAGPVVTTTAAAPASTSTTSAPTTTTITTTTTTGPEAYPGEARGACRPDPFAGSGDADLAHRYPGRDLTAHVFDIRTGCEYSLNPGNRLNIASVFKVMVMAGTLLEAQNRGRDVTESEMSRLVPMITESANWPVRSLWQSFGASPWFRETGEIFGLLQTSITADGGSAWGATKTSASDQVGLLRQVLLGHGGLLDEGSRDVAFGLMTSVVPDQTWGVTAGVPGSWTVAQKNGFAGRIINSVGWVDPPGEDEGYLVAILTYGWPNHPAGIEAVERISLLVANSMVDTVPGVE